MKFSANWENYGVPTPESATIDVLHILGVRGCGMLRGGRAEVVRAVLRALKEGGAVRDYLGEAGHRWLARARQREGL